MIKKIVAVAALVTVGFTSQVLAEGSAARAMFTPSIVDREPTEQIEELTTDNSKVYFFTELRGLNGKSVTHRWEYDGEPRAAVTFNVGSNRWRVWSSKNMQQSWTGVWKVSVVDEEGNVFAEEILNYVAANSADEVAEAEMVGDASEEVADNSASEATEGEMVGDAPAE